MLRPMHALDSALLSLIVAPEALILACSSLAATPRAAAVEPTSPPLVATAAPATLAVAKAFDQQFIDMMVPHHQAAVEMARVAQSRAQRPEIQGMSADIIRSQSAEIERLQGWRQAWYGSVETPPMDRMPMLGDSGSTAGHTTNADMNIDMARDVETLRNAPEPFEASFIEAMIPHHQMAVGAARVALQQAAHPELSDLAASIIDAQLREIGQMQAWRLNWYGSMRANMSAPTPGSSARAEPTPMQGMPGMMDEGH
jgi:uncharacterized protein (DUF305 family)